MATLCLRALAVLQKCTKQAHVLEIPELLRFDSDADAIVIVVACIQALSGRTVKWDDAPKLPIRNLRDILTLPGVVSEHTRNKES